MTYIPGTPAPASATYITQTADGTLTNEQALASLSTGLMKVTTATGVVSSVVPGTGVETFLGTPSSANLASALTDETGTGAAVFAAAPTLTGVVKIGGATSSFPAIRNTGAKLEVVLADASAFADFKAQNGTFTGGVDVQSDGSGHSLTVTGGRIGFGTTSSVPALRNTSTVLEVVLGDNSQFTNFKCANVETTGTIKIAGNAVRGTTEGTNHLDIFNGTAPVGTLTNGISLYAAAGELWVLDAANNPTQLSPHDKDGYWIFESRSGRTGKMFRVHMERLMWKIDWLFRLFGSRLIEEL